MPAFIAQSILYLIALSLILWPVLTFLWTSPAAIEAAYWFIGSLLIGAILLGLLILQIKRLQTIGRGWWWVLVGWIVAPIVLIFGTSEFDDYLRRGKDWRFSPGINLIDIGMFLGVVVIFAYPLLLPKTKNVVDIEQEHIDETKTQNLAFWISGIVTIFVATLTIYAGMFQSGIYVGLPRLNMLHEKQTPFATEENGHILAECAGFRGVSAGTQFSPSPGFNRFAEDAKYNFVLKSDNTLDIFILNESGVNSYSKMGYVIRSAGLKIIKGRYGSVHVSQNVNHFVIEATRMDLDTNALSNLPEVTSFSFTEKEYAGWVAIKLSAQTYPNVLVPTDPYTMAQSMIGDCIISMEHFHDRSDRIDQKNK
jgi:hypothetical protein